MKGKQFIIALLIAVAAVFFSLAAQAQSGNLQQARPMDIMVVNGTNTNWSASCALNKGNVNSCPQTVNPNTIATYSFGSSDYSVSGDSGTISLVTTGKKGEMVNINIQFVHPYGPDRTTLSAWIVQSGTPYSVVVDTSQLQHHHAVGKVTINSN